MIIQNSILRLRSAQAFKIQNCLFTALTLLALGSPVGAAEQSPFHNGLSLQGYTGVLNTPSAFVTEEGWLNALYSNQTESMWRQKVTSQDNYLFSLGLFNFIELGGRFTEATGLAGNFFARDLSVQAKITSAPLTKNYPFLPVIAVGVQDPGGGAVFLKSSYLVLSEEIWRLRMSAGYGRGPDRMKGGFAGVEFKAHDWVYLLGEYDTAETNVGVRVLLPQFWKVPVRFTATAKTSIDYKPGNFEFAFGMSMPLDFRMKRQADFQSKSRHPESEIALPDSESKIALPDSQSKIQYFDSAQHRHPESKIASILIREGLINVRVGRQEQTLVVEYENSVFNHNELDALGLVVGIVSEAAPEEFEMLRVIIKRRNIRMAAIMLPLHDLRAFLEGGEGRLKLRDNLTVDSDTDATGNVNFIQEDRNPGLFNTSLTLAPGLTTFVGTEVGAFDYLLSLKPELTTQFWKGAVANARWDIPLSWSDNLGDGKQFRNNRQPAQMDRAMLFQGIKPLPTVMLQLGAGMILHDRYGMLNEGVWNPGDGQHRFRVTQGWNEESNTHHQAQLLLGSYRYYYSPLDLSLEATAGKFWAEDKGFSLEMKRFWEDTAVSFYYKDTKGVDQKKWQAVGIQLSFPLTPRRDMKPQAKMQLRGSDEWGYAQETTLKNNNIDSSRGELNYLPPYPLAVNSQLSQSLLRTFYNRDRLSASYIRQHLDRLREAWLKYRANSGK